MKPKRFSGAPPELQSRPSLSRTSNRNPGACLSEKSIGDIELRVRADRTGPNMPRGVALGGEGITVK